MSESDFLSKSLSEIEADFVGFNSMTEAEKRAKIPGYVWGQPMQRTADLKNRVAPLPGAPRDETPRGPSAPWRPSPGFLIAAVVGVIAFFLLRQKAKK